MNTSPFLIKKQRRFLLPTIYHLTREDISIRKFYFKFIAISHLHVVVSAWHLGYAQGQYDMEQENENS